MRKKLFETGKSLFFGFAACVIALFFSACDNTGTKEYMKRYDDAANKLVSFAASLSATHKELQNSNKLNVAGDNLKTGVAVIDQIKLLEDEWTTRHEAKAGKRMVAQKAAIYSKMQNNEFLNPYLIQALLVLLNESEMHNEALKIYGQTASEMNKITKELSAARSGSAEEMIAKEKYDALNNPYTKGALAQSDLYKSAHGEILKFGFSVVFYYNSYFKINSPEQGYSDAELADLSKIHNEIASRGETNIFVKNLSESKMPFFEDILKENDKVSYKYIKNYADNIMALKKRINSYAKKPAGDRFYFTKAFYDIQFRNLLNKVYARQMSLDAMNANAPAATAELIKESLAECEKLAIDLNSLINDVNNIHSIYAIDNMVNHPVHGKLPKINSAIIRADSNYRTILQKMALSEKAKAG